MELFKNRWHVSQKELERLQELPKKELMEIIKGFKLGTGKLSRKRLEKDVYHTITVKNKPKKVHVKRTTKRSEPDNNEGQKDT